jgi:hypothetical protein
MVDIVTLVRDFRVGLSEEYREALTRAFEAYCALSDRVSKAYVVEHGEPQVEEEIEPWVEEEERLQREAVLRGCPDQPSRQPPVERRDAGAEASVNLQVAYADAETRGKLRLWRAALAKHYAQMDMAFHSEALQDVVLDLYRRSSPTGRERALAKIQAMVGPGCVLEQRRLKGKHPYAIFSALKPRGSVIIEVEGSLAQDCVSVNYLACGALPARRVVGRMDGLWSLEVPDHALGRAVERSRFLHPGAIIRQAHASLLGLPADTVMHPPFHDKDGRGALVKAGPDAFVVRIHAGEDVSQGGGKGVHCRASTWLAEDMLGGDQKLLEPGEPRAQLGDSWLRPVPFRRIVRKGDKLFVHSWEDER